jgi:hypothetical protein
MKFRIFTNDRRKLRGVPMYSALRDLEADSPDSAEKRANSRWPKFGVDGGLAPIVAIHWPKRAQSQDEKDWLVVS